MHSVLLSRPAKSNRNISFSSRYAGRTWGTRPVPRGSVRKLTLRPSQKARLPAYTIDPIAADIHDVPAYGKDDRLAVDSYYHGVEFYYRHGTLLSDGK